MIGKGRRKAATEYLMVTIDLVCERGHHVATAWKDVPPAPQPHGLHVSQVRWVDSASGGMVTSSCRRCGADPQWRWSRIMNRLQENEENGRQSDAMSP